MVSVHDTSEWYLYEIIMRNLFRYLIRNHVIILFLVLEVVSVYLIINYNNYQKAKTFSSASYLSAAIYKRYSVFTDYFRLAETNRQLAFENAELKGLLDFYRQKGQISDDLFYIIPPNAVYQNFRAARIINNSTNRQNNYITLDKGRKDGIKTGQGVIIGHSVVGQVLSVSESFSVAISLLNTRWSISAKLKKNDYFGTVAWDGEDYQYVELREIPMHVPLVVGDTIVTSGFSTIFPAGQTIGTIDQFDQKSGGSFYRVRIKLAIDFKSLSYVHVIDNPSLPEIRNLEKSTMND